MGLPAGGMQKLTERGAMRSLGAPSRCNEVEQRFWKQTTSQKAAEATGVSSAVGTRWFRHWGGRLGSRSCEPSR